MHPTRHVLSVGLLAGLLLPLAGKVLAAPAEEPAGFPAASRGPKAGSKLAGAKSTRLPQGNGSTKRDEGTPATETGPLPFVPPLLVRLPQGGRFSLDAKGITLATDDDAAKLRIGGRLHLDSSAASIRPAAAGPALSDDVEIRRAWLESVLTLGRSFEVAFQYDFSDTPQPINDALLAYRGVDPFILTLGNFKEPFSLDQLTSNNDTLFVERSLLDAFAPARDFGFALGTHGERWTAVAGVYGGNANTDLADNGVAATVRLTYAPILKDDQVLHLGIAGSYRSLDPHGTALSFASRPEDHLFRMSLVDTGMLNRAADVGRFGVEGLYQDGPYRVKAEYALTDVGGAAGQGARMFQAGYVEAAWVINGNGRPYKLVPDYGSTYAVLGGVQVEGGQRLSKGGIGVFELGARFSAIDLQEEGVAGGVQHDLSAGLNWYPDENIKVMADYVRARADPSAAAVTGRPVASDLFVGRVQFAW